MNDQAPTSPLRLGTDVWPQDRSPKAAVRDAPRGALTARRAASPAHGVGSRGGPGCRRRFVPRAPSISVLPGASEAPALSGGLTALSPSRAPFQPARPPGREWSGH